MNATESPRCFYESLGKERFVATSATAGPWDAAHQHGGPPSALLARAIERCEPVPGQRLARVAVDILRPLPLGELRVEARVIRAGRRVTLLEATASLPNGQGLAVARGWRIEQASPPVPPVFHPFEVGTPEAALPSQLWAEAHSSGYLAEIEWRTAAGSVATPGPADVWTRPRIQLVAGEETSPICRSLLVADSGNGVSSALEFNGWTFLNVDLTVATFRDPVGDWVLLSSRTSIDPLGTGLADTLLCDTSGPFGRGLQTLIVSQRPA